MSESLQQIAGYLQISALEVHTHIGVHAWEQRIKQRLLIEVHLPLDSTHCQDKLENTIDYFALCELTRTLVEARSFQLVETVVEVVGRAILTTFQVPEVRVTVSKPQAVAGAGNIQISSTLKLATGTDNHAGS